MKRFARILVLGGIVAWQLTRFCGLWLASWLATPRRGLRWRRERAQRLQAVCLVEAIRRMGATWIKIGQILSSRPDLLPPHLIAELETLQDQVPAEPWPDIERVFARELGRDPDSLFAEFEKTPVAAASIAQVHRAVMPDGQQVAVKIQRPGISDRMERDLSIIALGAKVVSWIPGIHNLNLPALAAEFARAIRKQLDFELEASNNRRFAENFADIDFVRVPELVPELCTRRMLVMEWIDGVRFRDAIADPPVAPQTLSTRAIEMYLGMAFRDRFVHADLHPGNLMFDAEGRFVLLDLGLVYEVPQHYVRKFVRVLTALTLFDGRAAAEAYIEGFDVPDDKRERMLADAEHLMEKYRGRSYSEIEVSEATFEIFALLRRHKIFLDAEWTGFMLAEITFEGIAKMIDKDADILTIFTRLLPRFLALSGVVDDDDALVREAESAARAAS
ncbi:MAG: AarF/ABC1/UbiB kinase family protein [Candidatus Dadabacteria bacterium]|nr:MAG: AarF/ABC1/UbiB kinase family protein [Candidatus Dadabacteria bacterium]